MKANKHSKQNQIKITEAKGGRSNPKMVSGKSEITEEHKERLSQVLRQTLNRAKAW